MLSTRLYYSAKPYLPWRLRLAMRRWNARRILRRSGDVWPIDERAGRKPEGWPGWPEGRQFALVLTHDVEGQQGLERVKQVAELEMELGFRSSFNFIPEGEYTVPAELRAWLTSNGFEVGVHDLHHDGRLYRSRAAFRRHAEKINRYLREWGAVGFRSGFMFHQLDWLHDLEIQYDASTFDTDPFEPQPDGVATIFPFWVPRPPSSVLGPPSSVLGPPSSEFAPRPPTLDPRQGYVELPYTLVQDYNLFIVLQETTIDIWKRKTGWIAERSGMVLLDTHPDYFNFGRRPASAREYSATRYAEFLKHVRDTCSHQYWPALPRDVAECVVMRSSLTSTLLSAAEDIGTGG